MSLLKFRLIDMIIKSTLEFPENLNLLIKNLVFNYQKMHINVELVDKNNGKKVRITFEGTQKMKDEFMEVLNEEIKNSKLVKI